jgi:hypothetical protein
MPHRGPRSLSGVQPLPQDPELATARTKKRARWLKRRALLQQALEKYKLLEKLWR